MRHVPQGYKGKNLLQGIVRRPFELGFRKPLKTHRSGCSTLGFDWHLAQTIKAQTGTWLIINQYLISIFRDSEIIFLMFLYSSIGPVALVFFYQSWLLSQPLGPKLTFENVILKYIFFFFSFFKQGMPYVNNGYIGDKRMETLGEKLWLSILD